MKWILFVAGCIELLIGLSHFAFPSIFYKSEGFSLLQPNEIGFVTLCVFSVGILLIAFGILTIACALKYEMIGKVLHYYIMLKIPLYFARIILEMLYPVTVPTTFLKSPTIAVTPLLFILWFLFLLSATLLVKNKQKGGLVT